MFKGQQLRINYVDYSLVNEKQHIPIENGYAWGLIDYEEETIQVMERKNEWTYVAVLLHEVIHGILFHQGKADLSCNEEIVDGFAQGITAFLKDNPDFVKYLAKIK